MLTITVLQDIGANNYRVLLAIIPPRPGRDGEEARSSVNSSRTYLPSGLRRVVDNPDTQILSRGRAPTTLKRSSLNLDLYL